MGRSSTPSPSGAVAPLISLRVVSEPQVFVAGTAVKLDASLIDGTRIVVDVGAIGLAMRGPVLPALLPRENSSQFTMPFC